MPVPPPDKLNERMSVAYFGSDNYIKLIKAESEKAIPVIIEQPASILLE